MKIKILFAVILMASLLHAQATCFPNNAPTNLSNIKIGSLPVGQDGLIHVPYGFDPTVDANTQNLFKQATQQWNGDMGTTGVVFEPAAAGQTPVIHMSLNPNNSLGCIAINAQTGDMGFNGDWQQLEANNPTNAVASISHELGHFLGLADAGTNPAQPTIMNNPFNNSCANALVNTTNVQNSDAQTAQQCTNQAQATQQGGGGGGSGPYWEYDPGTSPIIIDTEAEGFHLTSAENGVLFDISGTGHPIQIAWTDEHYHNAFLALPGSDGLVHNGKQLFGNFTPQPASPDPNGFLALAEFDKPQNGGNGDGVIDEQDAVYSRLRLWIDENHDGICQANELHTLPEMAVYSLALSYFESRRTDEFGNQFRYRARVDPGTRRDARDQTATGDPGRWTYDVFFTTLKQ